LNHEGGEATPGKVPGKKINRKRRLYQTLGEKAEHRPMMQRGKEGNPWGKNLFDEGEDIQGKKKGEKSANRSFASSNAFPRRNRAEGSKVKIKTHPSQKRGEQ